MLTCPAYTGRRSGRRFFGAKEELNLENVRGEKRRLLFPSRVSLTRSVTTTRNYDLLYDSLWRELSKVPGGYYLEKDFWYHKIPKYIASFWKSTPPAKVLANSQ